MKVKVNEFEFASFWKKTLAICGVYCHHSLLIDRLRFFSFCLMSWRCDRVAIPSVNTFSSSTTYEWNFIVMQIKKIFREILQLFFLEALKAYNNHRLTFFEKSSFKHNKIKSPKTVKIWINLHRVPLINLKSISIFWIRWKWKFLNFFLGNFSFTHSNISRDWLRLMHYSN